jgi:hypothetical protein
VRNCAGIVELPLEAVPAAKELSQAGRRRRGEVLPQRRRKDPAKLAGIERRVRVTSLQGTERVHRPVADAGLEQPVELGQARTDVFGHVFRFGLAVFDVKLLPFPVIGGGLPLPVTLGLGGLPGGARLGLLEFAELPLADTFPLRALAL